MPSSRPSAFYQVKPGQSSTKKVTPNLKVEAEKLLQYKQRIRGELQYLVKWKNRPDSKNSWEYQSHLLHHHIKMGKESYLNCKKLIRDFDQSLWNGKGRLSMEPSHPHPNKDVIITTQDKATNTEPYKLDEYLKMAEKKAKPKAEPVNLKKCQNFGVRRSLRLKRKL